LAEHLSSLRSQPAIRKHAPGDPVLPKGEAPANPVALDEILGTLDKYVFPYHAREPHPGFMAYVPSCPTFPAMVGDWISTGYNFYAGVGLVATGPNRVEHVVLDWFRRWLGMPEGSGGLLTTGGSGANLTAIVAARHTITGGDASLIPRLVMYTSDQAHSSVSRAGWMAGVSRDLVRSIATDSGKKMIVAELERAIRDDRAAGLLPFAVVASAGTTNTGAIDPMHAVADVCEREKLWMHVDAAYGGFAVLTDSGRRDMDGMQRADSITLDPHKCLYVPFECGCLMVREPRKLFDTYAIFPEYLKDVKAEGDNINFADYGEQLTRYNRAMKVWFSVNYFGLDAIRAAMQKTMDLARLAADLVRESAVLEALSPAQLGIFCFRVRPADMEDGAELDALNDRVLAAVLAEGKYFISTTRLEGRNSLRICVLGFRTSEEDVSGLIADVTAHAHTYGQAWKRATV
jgi:glutamate/tyrosine decarboxylase-like PLP-dependent enzyme